MSRFDRINPIFTHVVISHYEKIYEVNVMSRLREEFDTTTELSIWYTCSRDVDVLFSIREL